MSILINDVSPRVHYLATNGQTVFVVPFEWIHNAELKVYVNSALATFDAPPDDAMKYSTTGEGLTGGGSITFGPPGRSPGDEVIVYRDMPIARTTDMPTSGVFSVEALNRNFDDLTAMVQQTEVNVELRTLRMAPNDFVHPLNPIPYKYERAGKLLGFDADGQPTVYATGSVGGGGGGGGGGDGSRHWTGDGPPPLPWNDGDLWWESDSGNTYIYYDDGDSSQWVQQNLTTVAPRDSLFVTMAELKALDPLDAQNAFLTDAGREGQFIWREGDYTARAASDVNDGVYVDSNVTAVALGCWVRASPWPSMGADARWFGVLGDGLTNDAPAMQAALNFTAANGAVLHLHAATFMFAATVTVPANGRIEGTGMIGTWLDGWTAGTANHKSTIIFLNHAGIGFDVRSAYAGASIRRLSTYRAQPTPGVGWSPAAFDFDIRIVGSQDVIVEEIMFVNPTKAVLLTGDTIANRGCARVFLHRLKGQPLNTGIELHHCYDVVSLEDIDWWPFWSNDMSGVRPYQRANAHAMHVFRVDGLRVGRFFSIGYRYGVRFRYEAAVGGLPAGNASAAYFGSVYCDSVCTGVQVDPEPTWLTAHFDRLHCHGGDGWATNNYLIRDMGNHSRLSMNSAHLAMNDNPFIYQDGVVCVLDINHVLIDRWDMDSAGANAFVNTTGNAMRLGPIEVVTAAGGGGYFGGTGIIESNEWRDITPTVSTTSGALTSWSAAGSKWRRQGGLVDIRYLVSITNNGTGAGGLRVTLPYAAEQAMIVYGTQTSGGSAAVKGVVSPTTAIVDLTKYDGTYPGGVVSIRFNGSYQAT